MSKLIVRSKFFRGAAVYMVSNMISAAIPFMLLPMLTRYLAPEEYGQVAMFQVVIGALSAFVGLNVVGAAGRKYYDDKLSLSMKEYVTTCFYIIIISGIIILCILLLIQDILSACLGLEASWILWAGVVSIMSAIVQLRLGQWMVRENSSQYACLQVMPSVVIVLLSVLFVVKLGEGAPGRLSAQIIGIVIGAGLAFISLWKDNLLLFSAWNFSYAKEALEFGIPLIPHVAGCFLLMSIDRFVVNVELGLAEAGIYAVATQIAYVMVLFFDAINKAYVPWLYNKLNENQFDEKCKIVRYTYLWFIVILLGVGLVFFVGPDFIVLAAGEQYVEAAGLIKWLALGQGFFGMYLMVTNYIFYSKKTALLSIITVCSGILNIVLLIIFIRWFGMRGAPAAFCIAMGVRFGATWVVAQRQYSMPWFSFNVR